MGGLGSRLEGDSPTIMMDDVIADHAAVETSPAMKITRGADFYCDTVVTHDQTVASQTVHRLPRGRSMTNRLIEGHQRSAVLKAHGIALEHFR